MFRQTSAFIIVLTICVAFVNQAKAQGADKIIQKRFQVDENQPVRLNLKFGDKITVNGWDKDEVAFKGVININSGRLNDALLLEFEKENGALTISSDFDKELLQQGRYDDCPDIQNKYKWVRNDVEYVMCSDITYEVYVPHDVKVSVESISGDIILSKLSGPVKAKTISGFVDLSWLATNGADITIKTITGEAYTNLNGLQIKGEQTNAWSLNLTGLINGGGQPVELESISGNIYLREQ